MSLQPACQFPAVLRPASLSRAQTAGDMLLRTQSFALRPRVAFCGRSDVVWQYAPPVVAKFCQKFGTQATGPAATLQQRVATGGLRKDEAQAVAAALLQETHDELISYVPKHTDYLQRLQRWRSDMERVASHTSTPSSPSSDDESQNVQSDDNRTEDSLGEFTTPPEPAKPDSPAGLYLYGGVGSGKSMLMDLFFASAPIPERQKRRVHFHQFMIEVHERLHDWQQERIKTHGRQVHIQLGQDADSVFQVGLSLGEEISLLCFDEFQVTDVADALIIRRLFSALFDRGVVVVATSNRSPEQLYEAGLNRSYFEPFIPLLRSYCSVHNMDSPTDHRQLLSADNSETEKLYFCATMDTRASFEDRWSKLTAIHGEWGMELTVRQGRKMVVHRATKGACRFAFADLCAADVGAADFAAIAQEFDTVILDDVPQMTTARHNEAARFVILIDELYERGCRLGCFAAVPMSNLFNDAGDIVMTNDAAPATPFVTKSSPVVVDGLVGSTSDTWDQGVLGRQAQAHQAAFTASSHVNNPAEDVAVSGAEFAAIHELRLAFSRAASRLVEMSSPVYACKDTIDG